MLSDLIEGHTANEWKNQGQDFWPPYTPYLVLI